MDDLISRQAAIDALKNQMSDRNDLYNIPVRRSIVILEQLPSAQPELNEWCPDCKEYDSKRHYCPRFNRVIREALKDAKPERYTKEELKTILHGISLRLLSLRSAQHWQEDDETAKEIEFLAHLYEKVEADLKGKV